MNLQPTWLDRAAGVLSPRWQLRRMHARLATEMFKRHYEAAAGGRRTQGWRRSGGDANSLIGPALSILRENARDLVRNNPYAESALSTIADHTVGYGIMAKPEPMDARALATWRAWAETTDCDADGRHDFYGLQKLVMRTVGESGEAIVRRRMRFISDGFAIPMQVQVCDPDFLDTSKNNLGSAFGGGKGNLIVQGVEFDRIGRRIGYWLFPEHPGSAVGSLASEFVPAESVRHIFKPTRPGQVRAPSWFAPVLLRFKDFDEFEDATLMKQKIAACLAVITSDVDGSSAPLGTAMDGDAANPVDSLEPGAILNIAPGRTVEVVQPPQTGEYDAYAKTVLRAIATGLGVAYEDLTGDYTQMPFSAARMSRLRHEARVTDWRWRILIPQFCDPVWAWAMEVAAVMGKAPEMTPRAKWTPPPMPMVDPAREGPAIRDMVRSGSETLFGAIRAQGYDPVEHLAEIAAGNKMLDDLGITLDSDPRKTSAAGLTQARPKGTVNPDPSAYDEGEEEAPPVPARGVVRPLRGVR